MAEVPQQVLDYMGARKALTLATCGDDGPWAATLTFVNDGADIYVWTRPNSNTAKHIDQGALAAFTIDDYAEDWRQQKGIQGRGRAAPVDGEGIARAADLFGEKYPELRPGSTSAVVFYKIESDTLEFIDNSRAAEEGADFGAEYRRKSAFDLPKIEG
jgi:uncharacterized protein YhbP (UPF0306 family)